MLLMVERRYQRWICHTINEKRLYSRYVIVNNKHMKDYNKNKESSHFKYWDVNNVYAWAMRQKLPVSDSKQVKNISELEKRFIKSYNEESDERYLPEVDIQFLENLHNLPLDLLFLSDRIEIEKVEKLIPNLHNRTEYVTCIKKLKTSIKSWISFEKSSQNH